MRFIIKNITGDSTNTNPDLRIPRKLYACSDNLSNTLIVGPQETVSISTKAYEELIQFYPQFIQVIDTDGSPDVWAPFRRTVALTSNTWTLVDLGRVSGQIELHNDGTNGLKWSFSGFTAPDTAPDPKFISDLDAGEVLTFYNAMNPMRYIYLFSVGSAGTAKILVS